MSRYRALILEGRARLGQAHWCDMGYMSRFLFSRWVGYRSQALLGRKTSTPLRAI